MHRESTLTSAEQKSTKNPEPTKLSQSSGLSNRLKSLGVSLAFTSYQSNILYILGTKDGGGCHMHQSSVQRPMGLCVLPESDEFYLASGYQISRFANNLNPSQRANNIFTACYVARSVQNIGALDAHDIGVDRNGQVIFVNTRHNCLATTDPRHSFREIWRPSFISALVAEDRCHLNGMAMENGEPAYVTAVSRSDTVDGWRDRRHGGGIIIDVRTNQIICEGLSMPHSPRMHRGELWVLNSGTGELGVVEGASSGIGRFVPRLFCPGFTRGLSFKGDFAFVGLSRPRYNRFEGLPLDQRLIDTDSEPWTGVQVINLSSNSCVDWLRMDGPVAEIYDVALLHHQCAMTVCPDSPEIRSLVTIAPSELPSAQAA